jgi:hypothetical protein
VFEVNAIDIIGGGTAKTDAVAEFVHELRVPTTVQLVEVEVLILMFAPFNPDIPADELQEKNVAVPAADRLALLPLHTVVLSGLTKIVGIGNIVSVEFFKALLQPCWAPKAE